MDAPLVDARNLAFSYPGSRGPVLDIAQFSIEPGERVFLRGPSGSGKSTLLGLISGILRPDQGYLSVMGTDMVSASNAKRDQVRADHLGIIFQLFNLVPYLSVTANVTLPMRFSPARRRAVAGSVEAEARRLLAALGLDDQDLLSRRVLDLSVGQQQRVAAARALIGSPSLVIADEPTSALDTDARDRFIALLSVEAERSGAALLFVSHDRTLAPHFARAVDLVEINCVGHEVEQHAG